MILVANEIRKLKDRTGEYEVGEFLICREDTKTNNCVFNVNFQYEIVCVDIFLKLTKCKD